MNEDKATLLSHDPYEEYVDPVAYDLEEIPFMGSRLAFYGDLVRSHGGPLLDLACGTGHYALTYAQAGCEVMGVDITLLMLEHARAKAARLAQADALRAPVHFVHGDVRRLHLQRRFPLAMMTGNSFMMFLTDDEQEAVLRSVRDHLQPGGRFAFEVRNPTGHDLRDKQNEHWFAYRGASGEAVMVAGDQHYDAERGWMHWTTRRRTPDVATPLRTSRICCRFTPVGDLNARIQASGLTIEAQYGDLDRSPLTAASPSIVTVCKAP